jgi:hypothetical protein
MSLIYIPVSLGELFDKLSILYIKIERIKDEDKIKNIRKEKELLDQISKSHSLDLKLWSDLITINEEIWDIEDSIRIKYRNLEYDEEFMKMAQRVHELNDRRGELKREINIKYGSEIIEEKFHKS